MELMELYGKFMDILVPICFLVILIVQLKIVSGLRSQQNLILFYGKQIEEIRKMASGIGHSKRSPDVPPDESGLYEVLKE